MGKDVRVGAVRGHCTNHQEGTIHAENIWDFMRTSEDLYINGYNSIVDLLMLNRRHLLAIIMPG